MITETSKLSLKEIQDEIGDRQLEVLESLSELGVANNMMISKNSKLSLSCVCGRMNELRNKLKLVTFSHQEICPYTYKKTNFYKLINSH